MIDGRDLVVMETETMELLQTRGLTARRPPADYFTGDVWMEDLVKVPGAGGIQSVRVTFEPAARTAWHTHPLGQILFIVQGCGRAQAWGGPIIEFQAGDVVHFPPDEKHWHGAGPDGVMIHLAVQQSDGESNVTWLEKVTDAQYFGS
jgi:quercetin dioxygenase-like cupin family protein